MKPPVNDKDFTEKVEKVARQLKKARNEKSGFLHYASLIGVGGWLFALPVVAGAYLGNYLDKETHGGISWSLTLIMLGVAAGVFNIWYFLYRRYD